MEFFKNLENVVKDTNTTQPLRNRGGDSDDQENDASSNHIDDDLTDLIKALEVEKNEDAIVKIVLKRSEILDPIDNLCYQFLEIQRKLDHTFVNLHTNPSSHDRRFRKSLETKSSPSSALSRIPLRPSPSLFSSPLQVTPSPSPPLPPASSLILPLPISPSHPVPDVNDCILPPASPTFSCYSSGRKQRNDHSIPNYILPLTPRAFIPSYSISRGQQKASSACGDYVAYNNRTYPARGNYRGNRGNSRGYSENSYNFNVSRGGFANCDRYYRSHGNNRGYRGHSNNLTRNRGSSTDRDNYYSPSRRGHGVRNFYHSH